MYFIFGVRTIPEHSSIDFFSNERLAPGSESSYLIKILRSGNYALLQFADDTSLSLPGRDSLKSLGDALRRCLRASRTSVPDYMPIRAPNIGPCFSPNEPLALPHFSCDSYTITIVYGTSLHTCVSLSVDGISMYLWDRR